MKHQIAGRWAEQKRPSADGVWKEAATMECQPSVQRGEALVGEVVYREITRTEERSSIPEKRGKLIG